MSEVKEKAKPEDLRIEKLSRRHGDIIKAFETDTKELKDFLIEDAINNQEMAISTTYLWFYRPADQPAGYITLLADAIRVHGTPVGGTFLDKGVPYKTLPAIKIGRMCVDNRFKGRGIGTYMIYFTAKRAVEISESVGCRFIVVDAKRETGSIHFYKRLGFEILKSREKGTIPMYFDLIKLIQLQRQKQLKLTIPREETSG